MHPRRHGHKLVTMKRPTTVAAGVFKAECLAILDRVAQERESIVITKRGRPVARVVPFTEPEASSLRGSVRFVGDVFAPSGESWDADR
jgi:prevent-host-death family protein